MRLAIPEHSEGPYFLLPPSMFNRPVRFHLEVCSVLDQEQWPLLATLWVIKADANILILNTPCQSYWNTIYIWKFHL